MGQPPFHSFLGSKDAQTCVKSGYVAGDPYYVIKVAPGGVQDNPSRGLPVNTGLMLIFSQMTARLEAILLDEGLLTEIRTAAACALAASHWAPKELNAIGLVGTGVQAALAAETFEGGDALPPCIRPWPQLRARKAVLPGGRRRRLSRFRGGSCAGVQADPHGDDCSGADSSPRMGPAWHAITAVGADAPGKQELDVSLVAAADLLICDSHAQTFERGEFQHAAAAGAIDKGQVVEIGVALDRPKLHRT
eukprot:CAMPEP_0117542666 /NCGR_PEP_ID=MMETSP0784-20121206/44664_1 /TAXON_ID=39447 /ORGANISM="" /LENGTH=248 /DNA_ID=CAMNT_0005339423 /DNA_START=218 /DNA_END=960 /DNA_ORIENTATION=-